MNDALPYIFTYYHKMHINFVDNKYNWTNFVKYICAKFIFTWNE